MQKQLMGAMLVVLSVVGALVFQQVARTAPPSLTALDYEEIRQLYTRYSFGGDNLVDDGRMWAETLHRRRRV